MSKIRKVSYCFSPSGSPDVMSYKLYYVETGQALDYNAPSVDLGNPAPANDGMIWIDLAALNVFTQDTTYDFGVVAVDDVGNESAMLREVGVPFDLIAPDAPTNGLVVRE